MRLRPKIEILQREGLLQSRNDLNLTRGSRVFFFVVSERQRSSERAACCLFYVLQLRRGDRRSACCPRKAMRCLSPSAHQQ